MNRQLLLVIVAAIALALGVGFVTASFMVDSGGGDQTHTMQNGETMSGSMDTGHSMMP